MPLHYTNIYTTLKAGSSGDIAVVAPVGDTRMDAFGDCDITADDGDAALHLGTFSSLTGEQTTVSANTFLSLQTNPGGDISIAPGDALRLFDAVAGLAAGGRPTIDPTGETGTTRALVLALIALGVVIDGTP